ncbi:protein tesmin/TSO1-like CXC 2 [Silene latifolia]|uniref:protein tesmin/TSO1-like CXC 2 n=1 Tax=Silene latifolia TaxID=37657 RepID=UPI003D773645
MDTPERNQIGTPLNKIEESPFSNFANSLSPINAVKTIHVSQTFSSLSFTSPPSVFTSPHVSLQKESRFLRRHQTLDTVKAQCSNDEGNKPSEAERETSPDQQPNNSTSAEAVGEGVPCNESSTEPLCGLSDPRPLTYDCGSPDYRKAGSSIMTSSMALVPFVPGPSTRGSFGAEIKSPEVNHDNEETGCDWESLISCSTNLFVFDSPNDTETRKGPFRKSLEEETNVYASLLSRFQSDDANGVQASCQATSASYNEVHETMGLSTQPTENELQQFDQPPEDLVITNVNEYFAGETGEKPGNKNFNGLYRGIRRRCLTFEMARPKKSVDGVPFVSSLSSLQNGENCVSASKHPVTPQGDSSRCMFPGIGLHLNALAAASKDCGIAYQEMISPTSQEPLSKPSASASFEKDGGPSETGAELMEEFAQLNSNSPKKKRRKFEDGEGESCKRCNCKKSKCLKLYCECFAAGVYCVEPCSCQDCFNKPIHEDVVLATRKQIESRNPLAFAPKVIRTSDPAQEIGEDSTKTPASARHKRGCNCKKSSCLKKYCECYQGGVGCSINCRCEGCKNAFGRKDGSTFLAIEPETEEELVSEKRIINKSLDLPGFRNDDSKSSEFTLPKTPLSHFRQPVPGQTSSKGKPPRSSLLTITSSSSLHPNEGQGRTTFVTCESKIEKQYQNVTENEIPNVLQISSPPRSALKTLSPNSKRISPPQQGKGQSPKLRTSRKLILQSIPSFPSLTPGR